MLGGGRENLAMNVRNGVGVCFVAKAEAGTRAASVGEERSPSADNWYEMGRATHSVSGSWNGGIKWDKGDEAIIRL